MKAVMKFIVVVQEKTPFCWKASPWKGILFSIFIFRIVL